MHGVPGGRLLVRTGGLQQCRLLVEPSRQHQRHRQPVAESGLEGQRRVPGRVGHRQAGAERRADDEVEAAHQRVELARQQRPGTLGADVLDGRDEPRRAEDVRPGVRPLLGQLADAAAARQIVERRRRLRVEDHAHRVRGEIRQPDRLEHHSRPPQGVERRPLHRQLARRRLRPSEQLSERRALELVGHVAHAQRPEVDRRRPGERRVDHRIVAAVGAVDGVEHKRAVLRGAAHRPDLVHRPAERHRAVAADAAVSRAQPGNAACCRRRDDGAQRLGADRKRDQTRSGRGAGPGG